MNGKSNRLILKNILRNKICGNCNKTETYQDNDGEILCNQWMGEAIGWEWIEVDKKNTCENWETKE